MQVSSFKRLYSDGAAEEGKQDAAVIVSTSCSCPQTSSLVLVLYLRSCIEHGMGDNGRSSAEVHKAIRALELMRRHPGADHGMGLGLKRGPLQARAEACFEMMCGVFGRARERDGKKCFRG